MKQLFFTLLLLGVMSNICAQLDAYKYIVVPKKFEVFKVEDLHETSGLINFLFTKQGFNVVYDDAFPPDLQDRRCLGAYVDLEKNSNLFNTKLVILLKDCNNVTIVRSVEGSSRNKDYKKAYHEAIRGSFVMFEEIEYNYQHSESKEDPITVSFEDDIKTVDENEKNEAAAAAVVTQVATPEERYYKDQRPVPSDYTISEEKVVEEAAIKEEALLPTYMAKELPNGYELLDNESKLWLTIYETSSEDVFIAKNTKGGGMVYKKDSKWYFEYYKDSELVVEELSIIFQ